MPTWIKFFIGLVVALLVLALGAALLAPRLIDQRQLLRDFEIEIGQSLGRPTRIESIGHLRLLPTPSIRLDGVRVLDAEAWENAAREADTRKADARETNARETDAVGAPVWIAIDSLRLNAALWPLLSGRLVLAEVLLDRPQMRLSSASGQQLATASETRTHQTTRQTTRQTVAMPASGTPESGMPESGMPGSGMRATMASSTPAASMPGSSTIAANAPGASTLGTSPAEARPPALPPIRRLIIRDGQLRGPVASPSASVPSGPRMLDIEALNLTAGPLAPGRSGQLDATFTLKGEQPRFSMPGRAEAEIALAEPLTEVRLQPLRVRLGAAAGGQGLPIQLDTEVLIALPGGRVLLDPFELLAAGPQLGGTVEFYSTPAGLAMDAQMQVPPFDLRSWLLEQTAIALPGAADSLNQVGGQFELSLRGAELAIDHAVLTLDQAPVNALVRLRLPPAAPALELEANADVYGGRLEARLSASQPSGGARALKGNTDAGASATSETARRTISGAAGAEAEPSSAPMAEAAAGTAATLARTRAAPVVRLTASASAVDVAALLTDLQLGGRAQAPLTGLAEIELDLIGRGADPQAIMDSLGGEAAVLVRDGAVTMVDLGQLIIGTVGVMGVSREDAEDLTQFSVLSLTAKGADGRFRSEDIQLRSNLLAIDGSGRLELPTQRIALDLQAVMTKPPKGRGIKELEGIPIPITAKGPWADPRWEVDIKTALNQAAQRALREDSDLLDQLEERTGIKGLGDGLRQVLPGLLGP